MPDTPLAPRHGRGRLRRDEWVRLGAMAGVVVALHLIGWLTLATSSLGLGVGVTAYTLGMRHAFDADHIAAIDGTTRTLMHRGRRPLSVGFFFSLGHASVVFVMATLLSLGVHALVGPVEQGDSALHHYMGLIGTTVSGVFLFLIAAFNLVVLTGVTRVLGELREGRYDESALEQQLDNRGLMTRLFGRTLRGITEPWQIYPVGVLFGLGFDTVTEIGLLVLAGTATASGLPWYATLSLPVLFAAGMSLLDTIDGSFMNFAYEWAFSKPVRKIYYNLTITGLSVAVAFLVGAAELLGVLATELHWTGGFGGWISGLDLNSLGFAVVGLFVLTWLVALAVWRWGRLEQRWTSRLRPSEPELVD